jgi:hypothetical protein
VTQAALNLQLLFDARHVVECARELRARLSQDQWNLLAQLAAEIVSLRESETGQEVVVVPATLEDLAVAMRRAEGKG